MSSWNWSSTQRRLIVARFCAVFSSVKLDAHGKQVPCYSVFSGLWLVEKNKNKKTWCRKQTQTLLYSPILVRMFSVSYNNVMVSRLHAINSVLTNTTNLLKFILVRPPFLVPGSKIPTQAIIDLIHGFSKACSSLQSRAGVWQSAVRRGAVSLYPPVIGFQPRRPLLKNNVRKFGLQCYVFEVRALFCLKTFKWCRLHEKPLFLHLICCSCAQGFNYINKGYVTRRRPRFS